MDKNNFVLGQWPERQWTLEERAEMLLNEYKAYHIDGNDYWRGIKYALECLEIFKEDKKK